VAKLLALLVGNGGSQVLNLDRYNVVVIRPRIAGDQGSRLRFIISLPMQWADE
jgi:hypothetical protein